MENTLSVSQFRTQRWKIPDTVGHTLRNVIRATLHPSNGPRTGSSNLQHPVMSKQWREMEFDRCVLPLSVTNFVNFMRKFVQSSPHFSISHVASRPWNPSMRSNGLKTVFLDAHWILFSHCVSLSCFLRSHTLQITPISVSHLLHLGNNEMSFWSKRSTFSHNKR